MSRLDRHTRQRRSRGGAKRGGDERAERTAERLPPRRVKHPSNKQQMANWFYNSLIALFIALVCGLFYVGSRLSGH